MDFNFQVRPLLSDRCFPCHGPDAKTRMAKLRLDSKETALKALTGGMYIIKPGDPSKSEVIWPATATDPAQRMPPPWSNLSISPEETALIRRWIEQGAEFKPHWSFIPVEAVQVPWVPRVKDRSWLRNPIDSFVMARLEQETLSPLAGGCAGNPDSPPKFRSDGVAARIGRDRRVRRRPNPSRRVREWSIGFWPRRTMANAWPTIGWISARFADTYGTGGRGPRMSPWRDWVIRAFNENLSYDKFIPGSLRVT